MFHVILQLIYQFFCLRQRYLGSCLLAVAFNLNSVMDIEETVSDITIALNSQQKWSMSHQTVFRHSH